MTADIPAHRLDYLAVADVEQSVGTVARSGGRQISPFIETRPSGSRSSPAHGAPRPP